MARHIREHYGDRPVHTLFAFPFEHEEKTIELTKDLSTDTFREVINILGHTDNGNYPVPGLAHLFWASLVNFVLGSVIMDVDHPVHWL